MCLGIPFLTTIPVPLCWRKSVNLFGVKFFSACNSDRSHGMNRVYWRV